MGWNICLKLSLLENVLVLDKVADVTDRSSHPGRVCTWSQAEVCLIQPWGRKTGWSSFFPSALQKGDLCHGSSLANREVSALNQLYSEGTVCLCLSTLIPKSKTILLQVEYTHSQGLYTYSLFFHCQNHFPCSERGVVLIHASEQ